MGCPHQGRSGGLNAAITSRPLTHRGPHRMDTIERTASATLCPCDTSTSTWRSFATISSGLCLFLGIVVLLGSKAIPQGGPLHRGRINHLDALGAWRVFVGTNHRVRHTTHTYSSARS